MLRDAFDKILSGLRGDLSGALSAAIITLPMSIGYGIIAFAPLGVEFAPQVALLGVYSAVFGGLLAALFGGTPIQISGPKAPLTLVLGTFVAGMSAKLSVSAPAALQPVILIGLAATCVMIAGLCQVILGYIGAGNLVKYVPQPVVAGFMNGIAFLLIVTQIPPILGIEGDRSFVDILQFPELINPFTTLVGIATIAAIFIAKRWVEGVPASLTAVVVGSALYYGLAYFYGANAAGSVIGRLNIAPPAPDTMFQWFPALDHLPYSLLLPDMLATGLIIGLLASMESLLSSVASDNLTGSRHNSKKELIGQGLGNMACGLFGALPAAGSIPRSIASYQAGGRTWVAGILCAVLIFVMTIFLAPLVGKVPLVVIAGIILVVGVTMIDRWSLNLMRRFLLFSHTRREVLVDLCITLLVGIVTISINLMAAVAIGILIASALFIARMSRSIIKRKYFGSQLHSRKMRSHKHAETLEQKGDRIVIIELQGPLFFGSAEILAVDIEKIVSSTQYCILDFTHVNDIDSTGANIIFQIKRQMESVDKFLLFSHLRENQPLWNFLKVIHDREPIESRFIFSDTDTALEWAEDHLLVRDETACPAGLSLEPAQIEIFRDFSADELKILLSRLAVLTYRREQLVFEEGDDSRDLYLLTRGCMSVKIYLPEKNYHKRIFTYTCGTVLGEVAFLDGSRRSASVWAHEDSEVLCLSFSQFESLRSEHPQIATKLIINLSLEVSRRLRRSTDQVRLLADS